MAVDPWPYEVASRNLVLAMMAAIILLVLGLTSLAFAHEHQPGETTEQQRAVDFLRTWHRPKGNFNEIIHRLGLCCYAEGKNQDCFPVAAQRVVDGVLEVKPAFGEHNAYDHWYKVDTGVNEELQNDPRESPDGRSYVCILGNQVVCFVQGAGT